MMIDSDDSSSYSYIPYDGKKFDLFSQTSSNDGIYSKKKSFDSNNLNVSCQNWEITRKDIQGRTLLHLFAFQGNIINAKKLFSKSFPVDVTDRSLNTALHLASQYGHLSFVSLLLEQNALINRQNIEGKTALHLAVERDHKEIADLLLSYGADPNIVDLNGGSSLHYSSANGFLDISQSLLIHGAFVNIKDYSKESPLFWAIRESRLEQVDMLIKHGANPNLKNEDGETPYSLAQEFDEDDIAILLQKCLNNSSNTPNISSMFFPTKSQPVNFSIPNSKDSQQTNEYRPQSL